MSIDIEWERSGELLIAAIIGRLDSNTSQLCGNAIESGIGEDDHGLIMDLEKLSYISSAGLRIILRFERQFSGPGKKFAICSLSDSVREIISISRFDELVTVSDSRSDAINDLSES
ncbi:MAG: STAS domain-containing protein [Albidovulum sp.]|nr:STAS domain-containing protein [Albidovulum sp.]